MPGNQSQTEPANTPRANPRAATILLLILLAAIPAARAHAQTQTQTQTDPAPRAIPDARGLALPVAVQTLRLEGHEPRLGLWLLPRGARVPDSLDQAAVVALQAPAPGTPPAPGAVVGLWRFATAPPDTPVVAVPNLVGLPRSEARARLRQLGLPTLEPPEIPRPAPESNQLPETDPLPILPTAETDPVVKHQYPRPAQRVLRGTHVLIVEEAAP